MRRRVDFSGAWRLPRTAFSTIEAPSGGDGAGVLYVVYSETAVSAPWKLRHAISSAHCMCPSKPKSVAIFR